MTSGDGVTCASNKLYPSNGAVTTVKTRHSSGPCAVATSSVAAPELQPPLQEEYTILQSGQSDAYAGLIERRPPTLEQMRSLIAVPAGMFKGQSKGNTKPHKRGRQRDVVLGNDERVPWTKGLNTHREIVVDQEFAVLQWHSTSSVANTYNSWYLVAGLFADFTNYALCFDEYTFDFCEVVIQPNITETVLGGTVYVPGTWVSAVDVDDAAVPTAYADVQTYESSTQSGGTQSHYHHWEPQFAVAAYSGAFTSYSSSRGWVDCASPNVQFYGLKGAWSLSTAGVKYDLFIKCRLRFRSQH